MRLHELSVLVSETSAAFDSTGIVSILEEAVEAASDFQTDPSVENRNSLRSSLSNLRQAALLFDPNTGSRARTRISRDLQIGRAFGPDAESFCDDLLPLPMDERGNVEASLQERFSQVRELEQTISGLQRGLGLITARVVTETPCNLRITFQDQAAIDDLEGLEAASRDWRLASGALSRLLRLEPVPLQLISSEAGITVFGLNASIDLERLVSRIVTWVQSGIKDVLEIRRLYEQIHQIKGDLELPEIEVNQEFDGRVDPFAEELMDDYDWTSRDKDFSEVEDELKVSLATIFGFVGEGGRVDLLKNEATDGDKQLAKTFNELEDLSLEPQLQ